LAPDSLGLAVTLRHHHCAGCRENNEKADAQ
jgi:hypothetical protein